MMDMDLLRSCRICPRTCGADRLGGKAGACNVTGPDVYIARAALHFWEEPCISGEKGSGTVFFSGCSLHCVYCQNAAISHGNAGKAVTVSELADTSLRLQEDGAENINLVTPTHYAVQISLALSEAKTRGLHVPVVWNTGGYERAETLLELQGLVDVWLTDYKYTDPETSARYSGAPDYPETAFSAIREMVRQQPECVFDERGMLVRGVIVRHLVLPGHVREAKAAVTRLYEAFGEKICISLMNQYTPMREFPGDPLLSRKVTKREYERAVAALLDLGIRNAFIQEGGTAEESFIPPFEI